MNQKQFFTNFEGQAFTQAIDTFNQLSKKDQEDILKQLYYQAREANTPTVLGVSYRKLHERKTFDDFYNAWLPPKDYMKPFQIGNKTTVISLTHLLGSLMRLISKIQQKLFLLAWPGVMKNNLSKDLQKVQKLKAI